MNKVSEIPLPAEQTAVKREKNDPAPCNAQARADYWQRQLAGGLPLFELLPQWHKPSSAGNERKTITVELPEELAARVRKLANGRSLRLPVVFLAVYKLLLHKYSGLDDLAVGVRIEDQVRNYPEHLPVRTSYKEKIQFDAFLGEVQRSVTEALDHLDCPFPDDIIFQVNYAYRTGGQEPGPEERTGVPEREDKRAQSDVALEIVEDQTTFILNFTYNPDIYALDIIRRFSDNYAVLLSGVIEAPGGLVDSYPIITEAERLKLLTGFNNTAATYPRDRCVHQLFAEKVTEMPDATALVFETEQLTYRQLYEKCSDLALFLQSLGVGPDCPVGLCLERSSEMMVGIQGIFMAGGAYVPMDPDYPDSRLAHMLEDSQAAIVICQDRFRAKLSSLVTREVNLIALDESWDRIAARAGELKAANVRLRREVRPHHLAYVIYTSGSTGKPKGVMVEHRALMNRIDWMQRTYQLNNDDVILQKTPFSFDVSVWEFVWPLMAGATVVFARPDGHKEVLYLEELIREYGVSTLHFVPSMLHTYLEYSQKQCPGVKRLFCSGEALDTNLVTEYKSGFPNAGLHNLYGPTEAAIDVTSFDCSKLQSSLVPIGKPISNIRIYILDKHGNPSPLGVPGELHIAGDGLARGYLHRQELTAEKFVENPFEPGSRMYRSGDLARWMDDGNIEYLGRMDTQVKIRGFRIETGEIEARLNLHPAISNSCVVVRGRDTEKKLIAFYHAKDTAAGSLVKLPVDQLRRHLSQMLPDYMLPAAFVSLETLPLTVNGKLDRRALMSIDVCAESGQHYLAPRSEIEQQLVNIWAEVLDMQSEKIGVNDSFFVLGGHSLLVTQVISKIRNQFGADLPLNIFFEVYTVAGIAEVIQAVNFRGGDQLKDVEADEIIL